MNDPRAFDAATRGAGRAPEGLVDDLPLRTEQLAFDRVRASELLPTYVRRAARFAEEGIPQSQGLPELVDALRDSGDSILQIAGLSTLDRTWLLVFDEPPKQRPSDEAIRAGRPN